MFQPDILDRFTPTGLQAILNGLDEAVLVVNRALEVVTYNEAAGRMFGPVVAGLGGKRLCALFGQGSCPMDVLADTLATGRPVRDYQTEIRLASGEPGQVLMRTVLLQADDADGPAVALILRDVTEETSLRREAVEREGFGGMIGSDPRMRELYRLIEDVAPSSATVLIRGESGTGKELVARAVHFASARADGPFVAVNCSALTETLLESELFGHVKGAFTGATSDRQGRFEQAHGGTIFLDEIGDVSPVVQVKLLRVLQERVIERVGEGVPVPVDVRVVAATNCDLEDHVARGAIREDFYYRIRGVTLPVPPLRERRGDIGELAAHFLVRLERDPADLGAETAALLMAHAWPGNVRELEHAVEHAAVLSRGGPILPRHLPPELREGAGTAVRRVDPDDERARIEAALERRQWHRTRTARDLGIDRTTLWRKIKDYGLSPDD